MLAYTPPTHHKCRARRSRKAAHLKSQSEEPIRRANLKSRACGSASEAVLERAQTLERARPLRSDEEGSLRRGSVVGDDVAVPLALRQLRHPRAVLLAFHHLLPPHVHHAHRPDPLSTRARGIQRGQCPFSLKQRSSLAGALAVHNHRHPAGLARTHALVRLDGGPVRKGDALALDQRAAQRALRQPNTMLPQRPVLSESMLPTASSSISAPLGSVRTAHLETVHGRTAFCADAQSCRESRS